MKKNLKHILFVCLATVVVFGSCKEDNELDHTKVSAVENLFAPTDNANVFIEGEGSVMFEWEKAKAEDNGVVLYEVLFDKTDGDFSKPLYSLPSDGNGYQRTLSISYGDLSKVAAAAGIKPGETGKVKWTVWSSKGMEAQKSSATRILEIERPEGFTVLPATAYLTGTATEGGDDISKAVPFKKLSDGVFEVYTSLKAGAYHIAERNSGNPATYSVSGDGKIVESGTTTVSGSTKVYRIRLNFNTAGSEFTEIVSLGLWFAPENKIWYELPYAGGSSWEIKNAPVVFKQEGWGRDERYKFKFVVKNAAGASSEEWYGSVNRDNQRPTDASQPSYWYMVPVTNNQWDNCFKFNGNADNKNADIKVTFTPAAYTHSVTVK